MLKIGTRKSNLALWQANHFRESLLAINPELELEIITAETSGDILLDKPLDQHTAHEMGIDKGFFTKELEEMLLRGQVDMVVHSLKDLATQMPDGLELAAISKRAEINDLIITTEPIADTIYIGNSSLPDLHSMPRLHQLKRVSLGTASQRRTAQLLQYYTDIHIELIRGNVNTRIQKLLQKDKFQYDAILLAEAGLARLTGTGLFDFDQKQNDSYKQNAHNNLRSAQLFWEGKSLYLYSLPSRLFLPACGQGFLAIQIRADNDPARKAARLFHDFRESLFAYAERSFLQTLEAGCHAPVAALAMEQNNQFTLMGKILSLDGKQNIYGSKNLPGFFDQWKSPISLDKDLDMNMESIKNPKQQVEDMAKSLAEELLLKGGNKLI